MKHDAVTSSRDSANRRRQVHGHTTLLLVLSVAMGVFIWWASSFRIDEVARAQGQVIASSRVQVIQSVDGGVLSELKVREGDRVQAGQLLARLDQTRFGASMGEVETRLFSLQAKAARLRAEVTAAASPKFPATQNPTYRDQLAVEKALYLQRQAGLKQELKTLQESVDIARLQLDLVNKLFNTGDVSGQEILKTRKELNEAEGRLAAQKNRFLEQAQQDLAKTEDEIAQQEQVLMRRRQELADTTYTAKVAGIVKNVRITTLGGVLRAGEEMMQIVPVDDELIVEAKVSPVDISRVRLGQSATLRFDPFDYTIYGSVAGEVSYISADTLREETQRGSDLYYRVHVRLKDTPVVSSTGRQLDILPGMTAQVDIRAGDRTLMEYLLKPLRKTLVESFKER